MPLIRSSLAAFLALFLAGAAHASEQNIAYGPDPQQRLDICTPASAGPAPALLMIHGGSWKKGSRDKQARLCENLARQGVVAIPMDYRLAEDTPATTWPAQFNDAQLAMRWVRAHAAAYGIDPKRVCAEGDSAGGQLALLLGVVPSIEAGDSQAVLPNISPQAACVVAISGGADLVGGSALRPGSIGNLIGGGDTAQIRAKEQDASPALRVRPGAAPTLLIHGTADRIAPFAQALEMQAALVKAGVPVWLVSYDGEHILHGLSEEQRRGVFGLVASFVQTHALPGPPRRLDIEEALSRR